MQTLTPRARGRFHIASHEVTDLELFDACAVITLALYFALSTIETWDQASRYLFYVILVVYPALGVLGHGVRHGTSKTPWTPRWNKNFSVGNIMIIFTAVGGIVAINALVTALGTSVSKESLQLTLLPGAPPIVLLDPSRFPTEAYTFSLLPGIRVTLPAFMQFSLFPGIVDPVLPVKPEVLALISQPVANMTQQGLWQTFAVGYGEEYVKLRVILPFAKRFHAPWRVALLVITTWSIAHAMRAYSGQLIPILAAIAAGFVLWLVLLVTENLLAAVLAHAAVNMIALLPSAGFTLDYAYPAVMSLLQQLPH